MFLSERHVLAASFTSPPSKSAARVKLATGRQVKRGTPKMSQPPQAKRFPSFAAETFTSQKGLNGAAVERRPYQDAGKDLHQNRGAELGVGILFYRRAAALSVTSRSVQGDSCASSRSNSTATSAIRSPVPGSA